MTAGGGQVIWEAPHRTTNLHGWQFSPNTLFLWKVTNREERVDIQVIQLLSQCVKLKNDPSTLKRRFSLPEPYKRFDQTVPCYRGFPICQETAFGVCNRYNSSTWCWISSALTVSDYPYLHNPDRGIFSGGTISSDQSMVCYYVYRRSIHCRDQ